MPPGKVIVPILASPRRAWPPAVNTPRAMALDGPDEPGAVDMIWTYSVPEAARGVAGDALAAVTPVAATAADGRGR